jgi:hypothetical protein
MQESRWLPRLGPPVVALGALIVLGSASLGAAAEPWNPPDCAGGRASVAAAARSAGPAGPERMAGQRWFRLDPRLDAAGGLSGQHLSVGETARRGERSMDLPVESSASGPFGHVVLVVEDDGRTSRIHALETTAGCRVALAEGPDVVRRAALDPAAGFVYETRVDRTTRADLGVWRRPLDGSRPAERVLDPLPADTRFGITWSTELSWSSDGTRLVVESCGSLACRIRLLDPATGVARLVADPGLGEVVGVDGDTVVTHGACHGLPCPVIATDVETGRHVTLAVAAGLARLASTPAGTRVAYEVPGIPAQLRIVDLAGRGDLVAELPEGARLAAGPGRSMAGVLVPDGWLLLARDGRPGGQAPPLLVNAVDGRVLQLREVLR